MYHCALCLGLSTQYRIPYTEQIELFKNVGFEAFFINWEDGIDFDEIKRTADKNGMIIQSMHAPFHKMMHMWEETELTQTAVSELIRCVDDCILLGTDIMVVHAYIGFEKHSPNEYGIENYRKVVEYAKIRKIRIAFENTEGEEYLVALMEAFKDYDNVGFCWDTGHEMCYNYSKDMMALYGDRLIAMHLNDNLGIKSFEGKIDWTDDLHLLPFDGIADWNDIADRLNRCGYSGMLTFEMNNTNKPGRHENDAYAAMDIPEYITNVYMRACRFAALKAKRQKKMSEMIAERMGEYEKIESDAAQKKHRRNPEL